MVGCFADIAWSNDDKRVIYEKKMNAYKNIKESDEDYVEKMIEKFKIEAELDEAVLSTIVFSALTVEAYIYDYGARNLGDKFTKDYLDKLDVVSKWIVVPKLITGKQIPKDGQAYCLLKNLIKVRNNIVHNKSKDILNMSANQMFEEQQKIKKIVNDTAKQATKTLMELAKEIETIDPNERASAWLVVKIH